MLTRNYSLFIGKDIDRTSTLTGFPNSASNNLADGEILVLDKDKNILTAGSTISDTDTIYICEGTNNTYNYTNKAGTSVTGVRKIIYSDPIEGRLVKNYKGQSYSAKSEQVDTFDITGLTVTNGIEYLLRIVYKDVNEHPGQYTETYRYVAGSSDTIDTVAAGIVARVSAHSGARVTVSYNSSTDVLTVTGKALTACTSGLSDIDEFSMVEFDAYLNYVDSSGIWQDWGSTHSSTKAVKPKGSWEQLRDMEKWDNRGATNKTHFPVLYNSSEFRTTKDETYDMIIIEHDKSYQSPDNQYVKQSPATTVVAIPVPSESNQMSDVLAVLNPWMASLPKAFDTVSV